jgi:hypothetical protein
MTSQGITRATYPVTGRGVEDIPISINEKTTNNPTIISTNCQIQKAKPISNVVNKDTPTTTKMPLLQQQQQQQQLAVSVDD